MRPAIARLAAGTGIVLFAALFGPARAADEPVADRLPALIAALQAEEAKFRDIEYALRITTRKVDPQAPERPTEVAGEEQRRVVLQGDRVYLRRQGSEQAFQTKLPREEVSAFDGERTRTVLAGNSANIHVGRFEHPDVYPAHTLSLIHYKLNFPLSVYLRGAEAIRAHPKYGHFARPSGFAIEFPKVVTSVEGEEAVGDLRCLKLRCQRWYYKNDKPAVQLLWLCPDRNLHCVKEQLWRPGPMGEVQWHEMRVEEFQEAAPGRWMPARVVVENFGPGASPQSKPVVALRTQTIVERVDLAPRADDTLFREVAIPADLPVFTIKDGALAGSALAEPIGGAEEEERLKQVVARVQEEERRYSELAVNVRSRYRHVHSDLYRENVITEISKEERSVLHGSKGYFTSRGNFYTAAGQRTAQHETQWVDGHWTRVVHEATQSDDKSARRLASLRKVGGGKAEGRHDGIPVFRPHTFLGRDDWLYGPFADLLVSPWYDKINEYRMRFRYCGEAELAGRPCVKVRADMITREGQPPHGYTVYWLAMDRNFIPIQVEYYGGNFGHHPLPTGISRCSDLREIAPGVWYPFRTTQFAFHHLDMMQRRLVLTWRRDYEVDSVELKPQVDDNLFREVTVPAGTKVTVSDEEGKFLGSFVQEQEGPLEIAPSRYLAIQLEAKVRDEERQAREKALQALVGKLAPEFPKDATWLNGKPLTWEALRGKVVVLDFWAEWCGPCHNDFPQLRLVHEHRDASGLTLIGIHPPGSELESIKKVTDEFHLDYPTCIDVPPQEGVKAWGDLFGQFAVHAIPHAVAVDGTGTVIASGKLQDVLTAANLAQKKAKESK